jgi:predicted O-linked N-acetylglucosamine transferase (SPINDLY family)
VTDNPRSQSSHHPQNTVDWLDHVATLLQEQQLQAALAYLQQVHAGGVDHPDLIALITWLDQALAKQPVETAIAHIRYLHKNHHYQDALHAAQALAQHYATNSTVWSVLADSYALLDDHAAALQAAQQSVAYCPQDPNAHLELGVRYRRLEQLVDAEACYQQALRCDADCAAAYVNLGNLKRQQNQLHEAERYYQTALRLQPDHPDTHYNLGLVLENLQRDDEAEAVYRRLLSQTPDHAHAANNLGVLLSRNHRYVEAQTMLQLAIRIAPQLTEAHFNLGVVFEALHDLNAAERAYRNALKSNHRKAASNLLFALNYHPDHSAEKIFSYYQDYDRRFGQPFYKSWPQHKNPARNGRRLKIGYVSPDFRAHAVHYSIEPLLTHHNLDQFIIYAYAELSGFSDAITDRLKKCVTAWHPTFGLTNQQVAKQIRNDGIDILVDLAGHTGGNRLDVFALKPAPVSVSWIGCGYTTGLSAIDYYLTDAICAPLDSQHLFSEQLWHLPTPAGIYRPAPNMGIVSSLPALHNGFITFITLTRAIRLNDHVIAVWSAILKKLPTAKLIINSGSFKHDESQMWLLERFAVYGVTHQQLNIGYQSPPWDSLRQADIALDCFPHNAGLTLVESLYMGLPFITLAGRPSVGRLGASILEGIGHPEWIAYNEEDYIAKVVDLASDQKRLADIRAQLRPEMQASPLMDEAGFTRHVEDAYEAMFERWYTKHRMTPTS